MYISGKRIRQKKRNFGATLKNWKYVQYTLQNRGLNKQVYIYVQSQNNYMQEILDIRLIVFLRVMSQ
jgi:hypothetical protein